MDFKLELVALPVSDVDKAKAFYVDQVGFVADHDQKVSDTLRFVQLTPPGSACSVCIGVGITPPGAAPVPGITLVVADVEAARAELLGRGVEVSDIDDQPWSRFAYFQDPDGNRWSLQQIPARD
jgi:catechol 2,3-dioxygenase-like lactoylglutathione lyase family enzyme